VINARPIGAIPGLAVIPNPAASFADGGEGSAFLLTRMQKLAPAEPSFAAALAAAFVDTTNHLRYSSAIRVKANRSVDLTRCPYAKPHAN